jgi:hypothetical protein
MWLLSDLYIFPVLQLCLLCALITIVAKDVRAARIGRAPGARMSVIRGDTSMSKLSATYGVLFAAIITVVNATAFRGQHWWSDYSIIINFIDLLGIFYVCYFSGWGRDRIFRLHEQLKIEN